MILSMKNLYLQICVKMILCFALSFFTYEIASAQCNTAFTPQNVTVALSGGSTVIDDNGAAICGIPIGSSNGAGPDAELVDVCIGFDIGCDGSRPATSPCNGTPDGGLLWHAGLYSQSSPAPNGLNVEYGTSTFIGIGCDATQIWDGGDYGTGAGIEDCMYPKASTCFDVIMGQQTDADGGPDEIFAVLGGPDACTLAPPAAAPAEVLGNDIVFCFTAALCSGVTYDVFLWEYVINQDPNTYNDNLADVGEDIACNPRDGNGVIVVDESTPSSVVTITVPGELNYITPPSITVDFTPGDQVCASGTACVSSDYQLQPDVTDAANCGAVTTVGQIVDGDGDGVMNTILDASDPNSDLYIGMPGAAPYSGSNGVGSTTATGLELGPNVFEINCRDAISISYDAPIGCGGVLPLGNGESYTDAAVYVTANVDAWPYVFDNWDPMNQDPLNPNTFDVPQCADNPTSIQCPSNLDGGTQTYPNNYTLLFGPFVNPADGSLSNTGSGGGNPFPVEGSNPLLASGATTMDFGDGIMRTLSTICVRYEDPCNGTKSQSCATFISDASPMEATADVVGMSCAGADNGQLIITGLVGGSQDPDLDGDLAGGLDYVFNGSPAAFTQCSPGVWETDAVVPPGVYTVTVEDPLAAACGSACDVELEFVIRDQLPSTIVGAVTVCPDQCAIVEAILQTNPISEFPATDDSFDTDPGTNADIVVCGPAGSGGITTIPVTITAPSPAGATSCSSVLGTGATDASLVDFCFDITGEWDGLSLYIDHGAGGTGSEQIWSGTSYGGGSDTDGGGITTQTFCVNADGFTSNAYDGTLDGNSFGGSYNDTGLDPAGPWTIYLQDLQCGMANEAIVNGASIEVIYRCVIPEPATICAMVGMDALDWTFDSGASDLLVLDGPMNVTGEFCAPAGTTAGDNVYTVNGFHTSNAMIDDAACGVPQEQCCPITGTVTVTVLDVPPPPTPSLTDGQEFCESDPVAPLTFTPPLSLNPGAVDINDFVFDGFGEIFISVDDPNGAPVGPSGGEVNVCGGAVMGAGGNFVSNLPPANNSVDYPGEYTLCVGEDFGDGLNAGEFTIVDQCGTVLMTDADWVANSAADPGSCDAIYCVTFEVQPNQLVVTGPVVQTADPDGIANNGDEVYEFDPAAAAIATGGDCMTNLIEYEIVTTCGCMVMESLNLFVYDDPTAAGPIALTNADCAVDGTLTIDEATVLAILGGGSGEYALTWTDGQGNMGTMDLYSTTDAGTPSITIDGTTATSPITVTVVDADNAYMSTVLGADGVTMLMCDGNMCETSFDITFEPCCAVVPDPTVTPATVCEGEPATLMATCGAGETTNWYADDGTGAPDIAGGTVATGGSFSPADVAAGTYTYYAECEDADGCISNPVPVTLTIEAQPTIDTPVVTCTSGPQPLNPMPTGGTYSGSGAGFVVADQVDPAGQTPGTYDLTYTVGNCSVTIQFTYDTDCDANGGQF